MVVFRLVDLYDKNTFFLIDKLDKNRIDLIGFTTYPYLNASYATPGDLPGSYYTDLLAYTGDVPVAFTEIGWSSSALTGGTMQEQAAYLDWFINHTAGMPIHMVCWLNLHDMAPAGEEIRPNQLVGLRRNDGMAKPVWERWTAIHDIPYDNDPPARPQRPHGETDGTAGTAYPYTADATDPDGDLLLYRFDWDDGTMSSWLGPYPSGGRASATHTWNRTGTYGIRVKVKDIYGEESDWSDPLAVSMPLSVHTGMFSHTAGIPGGIFTMLLRVLYRWIPGSVIPST